MISNTQTIKEKLILEKCKKEAKQHKLANYTGQFDQENEKQFKRKKQCNRKR